MEDYIEPSELRAYIKRGNILQNVIANELGLSQGQVSRLLSGQFKKPGKAYFRICKYVKKRLDFSKNQKNLNDVFKDAITNVWDGSAEHAEMISNVIRSLGPFRKGY